MTLNKVLNNNGLISLNGKETNEIVLFTLLSQKTIKNQVRRI